MQVQDEATIKRLRRLKIVMTALQDARLRKIYKWLFFNYLFLIDHYLNEKLSARPLVFGYNYYVYKYGVFTAEILHDLQQLKTNPVTYVGIPRDIYVKKREMDSFEKVLYNEFVKMAHKYVKPHLDDSDTLTNYIFENLLGIKPYMKEAYLYTPVSELIEKRLNR